MWECLTYCCRSQSSSSSSSLYPKLQIMFRDPNCNHSEVQGPYPLNIIPSYLNTYTRNLDVMNLFATKRLRRHFPVRLYSITSHGIAPLPLPSTNTLSNASQYVICARKRGKELPLLRTCVENCNRGISVHHSIFIIY